MLSFPQSFANPHSLYSTCVTHQYLGGEESPVQRLDGSWALAVLRDERPLMYLHLTHEPAPNVGNFAALGTGEPAMESSPCNRIGDPY